MQRVTRGHHPQGSVLAGGNLQKAARAKVTGVREDLPAGLAGGALAPRRPAPSQRSRSALRALPRVPGPSSLRRPRRLLRRARSRGPEPPRTVSRESGLARRSRHCSGLPGGARGACAAAYGSPEGGVGGAAQVSRGGGGGDDDWDAARAGTMSSL